MYIIGKSQINQLWWDSLKETLHEHCQTWSKYSNLYVKKLNKKMCYPNSHLRHAKQICSECTLHVWLLQVHVVVSDRFFMLEFVVQAVKVEALIFLSVFLHFFVMK